MKRAGDCCKKILNHVNQAVKEAENKQVETVPLRFHSFTIKAALNWLELVGDHC